MIEGEGGEHGAVSVDVSLHQERCAADAVERNLFVENTALLRQVGHQRPEGCHLGVALQQDLVRTHLLGQLLRGGAILPVVEIVGALVHLLLLGVPEALEAVGRHDGLVVAGQVLDDGRRGLDDIGVKPQDPRCRGAQSREEQRIAGLGHGGPPNLLVRHLVALALVLRRKGRLNVLAQDDDALEPVLLEPVLLCLGDPLLQLLGRLVALLGLGQDEAESDQFVGVLKAEEVVPVGRVEAGHRGQKQDVLAVLEGVRCDGDIVEVVACDGRRLQLGTTGRLAEGRGGRRERMGGGCGLSRSGKVGGGGAY